MSVKRLHAFRSAEWPVVTGRASPDLRNCNRHTRKLVRLDCSNNLKLVPALWNNNVKLVPALWNNSRIPLCFLCNMTMGLGLSEDDLEEGVASSWSAGGVGWEGFSEKGEKRGRSTAGRVEG